MAQRILHRDEVEQFYESMREQRRETQRRTLSTAEAAEILDCIGKENRQQRAELEWHLTHDARDGDYPGTKEGTKNG
jgi:hypothetical protein